MLVGAALLLQFSIGAVYAPSVFAKAFQDAEPWSLSKVAASLPFTVTIAMIFVGTYIGGRIQDKKALGRRARRWRDLRDRNHPRLLRERRRPALAGHPRLRTDQRLRPRAAYIVPIAMLQKWFPDKKGLIPGLAVGGFGFGAVLTSPVAQWLIGQDPEQPAKAFLPLGVAYLAMSLVGASFFRNPPEGYVSPATKAVPTARGRRRRSTPRARHCTPQWYSLTAILALNTTIGIALISQAAGSASGIAGYSAAGAATVVGVLAVFNGAGRIAWAAASDYIGRRRPSRPCSACRDCACWLSRTPGALRSGSLGAVIYLCYGGGFGTMPATAGDYFGVKNAGAIYGLMLIAWSIAASSDRS